MVDGPPLTGEEGMLWVGDYIGDGARHVPDRAAIVDANFGGSLTNAELDRRIGRAMTLFAQANLKLGDRFAYLGKNSAFCYVLISPPSGPAW